MAIFRIQKQYSEHNGYTKGEKAALGLGTSMILAPITKAGYLEFKNRGKGGCPDKVLNAALVSGMIGNGINLYVINKRKKRENQ